ncbi:MAG: hypothetical protein HEQ13_02255 [Dolichospermum sp. DEX189]|nr:hypothetical protein [Dolichospermum sp. DEX189]MBO1068285.1 hypothetical protein [Dolichospermum sp. DEX189]
MSLWQGKRQEARGKSEEGLGDFTFLYTVWFYCVHLSRLALKIVVMARQKARGKRQE